MTYESVGLYGPTAVLGQNGAPVASTPVTVYQHGTTTDAALWTDNTGTSPAANPVTTDTLGNLAFYVTPGLYDLSFTVQGTATTLTVLVEPWFVDSGLPSGLILPFGGGTVPAGFLMCDGSAVSRTTYASLFAAIGTTWGVGNGSTTFNVPNAHDRVLVGAGASFSLGTLGGANDIMLAQSQLPNYELPVSDPGHIHTEPGTQFVTGITPDGPYTLNNNGSGAATPNAVTFTSDTSSNATGISVASGGSGAAIDIMQAFAAVNCIIKA